MAYRRIKREEMLSDLSRAWLECVAEGVFPSLREMAARVGLSRTSTATAQIYVRHLIDGGTFVPLVGGKQVHTIVPTWVQEEAQRRLKEEKGTNEIQAA